MSQGQKERSKNIHSNPGKGKEGLRTYLLNGNWRREKKKTEK